MTTSTQIGYARCSTDKQDLTAQREALINLGVNPERVYTDHGLTGRTRARPGSIKPSLPPAGRHARGDQTGQAGAIST